MLDEYLNQEVRVTVTMFGKPIVVVGRLLAFDRPFLKLLTPQAVRLLNVYTIREITPTKRVVQRVLQ